MNGIWNATAFVFGVLSFLAMLYLVLLLVTRIRGRLAQLACKHAWSKWYVTDEVLVGPLGRTVSPIQEQSCDRCGFKQRAELKIRKEDHYTNSHIDTAHCDVTHGDAHSDGFFQRANL